MHPINRVAILGAGALGAAYASMFFDAGEFNVSIVARGARRERLLKHGLMVNGKHYQIAVQSPSKSTEACDLILVALKHHHLQDAVRDLENFVGEETTIISVMNGLDSEETLGAIYGREKVLYAIAVGIDALREENQVNFTNRGKVFFGEEENSQLSEPVRRLQAAFEKAGIPCETPVDMMRMMWWKFMVNVGMNQSSAVMHAAYGVFQESSEAQALMEALMYEVVQLAGAVSVNLDEADIEEWYTFLNSLSPGGKTSMLQDIEAGRKTEVELFGGKVVELGEVFGIPTPVNQTLVRIIQVMEKYPV